MPCHADWELPEVCAHRLKSAPACEMSKRAIFANSYARPGITNMQRDRSPSSLRVHLPYAKLVLAICADSRARHPYDVRDTHHDLRRNAYAHMRFAGLTLKHVATRQAYSYIRVCCVVADFTVSSVRIKSRCE